MISPVGCQTLPLPMRILSVLPPSGMPDAPTSSETFGQAEGGGDVMESSPQ